MKIIYLTKEQVQATHGKTIEKSGGGSKEPLNLPQLESVLYHIQNDEYYPYFSDKVAHLFFGICKFHCFSDGNKRLAITASAQFLLLNGHLAIAQTFFENMENISYHVASGLISEELLKKIMISIIDRTFNENESLKLEIANAISGN